MPPGSLNRQKSSNRAQSMRFNFGPGGIMSQFARKKKNSNRQSMSPASLLGSPLPSQSSQKNNPLLMKPQDLPFVKNYEQSKLAFDVNFETHQKQCQDLRKELENINQSVEGMYTKNEELIERIFHNTLDFESAQKGKSWNLTNQMKLRELFKMFDQDEDGSITETELKTGLKKLGKEYTDEEISEMMLYADANGNGDIDFGEFISLMLKIEGDGAG